MLTESSMVSGEILREVGQLCYQEDPARFLPIYPSLDYSMPWILSFLRTVRRSGNYMDPIRQPNTIKQDETYRSISRRRIKTRNQDTR